MNTPRRGFALAAVVLALVVLAALTAAAGFAALLAQQAGRNALGLVRARAAARAAIDAVVTQWDVRRLNGLVPGADTAVTVSAPAGASVAAHVRHTGGRLFAVFGLAASGGAEQRLAAIVRLHALETLPAAVRARSVSGVRASDFDGTDRPPVGWDCPAASDTVPPLLLRPGEPDSAFFRFGDRAWADVRAWAAAVPPGGDSLEVHYAARDTILSGGRILGVVVVDGDLTLRAGVEIVGMVVTHGSVILEGAGGSVTGVLVASQVIAISGVVSGVPVAQYSSCATEMAATSRVPAEFLRTLPLQVAF